MYVWPTVGIASIGIAYFECIEGCSVSESTQVITQRTGLRKLRYLHVSNGQRYSWHVLYEVAIISRNMLHEHLSTAVKIGPG